jgi:hypothetical protein
VSEVTSLSLLTMVNFFLNVFIIHKLLRKAFQIEQIEVKLCLPKQTAVEEGNAACVCSSWIKLVWVYPDFQVLVF